MNSTAKPASGRDRTSARRAPRPLTERGRELARAAQARGAAGKTAATRQIILDAIGRKPMAGATTGWLIAMTGRSKSTVLRTLRALLGDGKIVVAPDPHDPRIKRYSAVSP